MHQKISCPINSVFEGQYTILTQARVHGAFPKPHTPPPPPPRQSIGKPTKKKPWLLVYTSMFPHTFFFNPMPKPIIEAVGKRHFGSQDRSNQPSNTEFLCFEFLKLVELLSDTVCSVNLRHCLGIYAIFLGNLRRFGEKITPIYTTWGLGCVNPHKSPACSPLCAGLRVTPRPLRGLRVTPPAAAYRDGVCAWPQKCVAQSTLLGT